MSMAYSEQMQTPITFYQKIKMLYNKINKKKF